VHAGRDLERVLDLAYLGVAFDASLAADFASQDFRAAGGYLRWFDDKQLGDAEKR
jgi:hypothetical protein